MPERKEYHSDPYLASNQEEASVEHVLPTKRGRLEHLDNYMYI